MAERAVRIGFVGVGRLGQAAHLRNYASLPGCEVVALAELRPKLGEAVAQRYGVPHVYRDGADMLAHEQLDGVVVSQSCAYHGQTLPPLFAAGVPVFSEKALASSVEVGEELVTAARAAGTWHMVGYQKRCDPATSYAKREIVRLQDNGELGALRYVRLLMPSGDWIAGSFSELITSGEPLPALPEDPRPATMDQETFETYRTFVNICIHPVNMLRHLLGEPYRVTYADRDGVLLVAESASGVTGVIELKPYQTTVDWHESALIAFEHGYVKFELPPPMAWSRPGRVKTLRDPGQGVTPELIEPRLPAVGAMRQQALAFLKAIRGEAPPPCEAAEALEDLRVAREFVRLWKGR